MIQGSEWLDSRPKIVDINICVNLFGEKNEWRIPQWVQETTPTATGSMLCKSGFADAEAEELQIT